MTAYIQNINHEHGAGDRVLSNSSEESQPVREPHRLVVQHSSVQVELVVQQHKDPIVCEQLDNIHQPVKGGSDIKVVTAHPCTHKIMDWSTKLLLWCVITALAHALVNSIESHALQQLETSAAPVPKSLWVSGLRHMLA